MSVSFTTLATSVVGISLIHALVPHHWLPFVIIGRKQGWTPRKILSLLSIGAFVHTVSTVVVGLLVGYLGHTLDQRFERFQGIIPGLILFAFGSGFWISGFGKHHEHMQINQKVAASSLIFMLGISPCLVVAPFFMMMGPLDFSSVLKLAVLMAILSTLAMTLMGWFVIQGLNILKLEWLERNEPRIMGTLLMILGISFIFHH